jgi:hypothetical protein
MPVQVSTRKPVRRACRSTAASSVGFDGLHELLHPLLPFASALPPRVPLDGGEQRRLADARLTLDQDRGAALRRFVLGCPVGSHRRGVVEQAREGREFVRAAEHCTVGERR